MTKKTSIKKQLIASIVAIALCFTSLIGTTFAWFTDSVTSSGNVIQTGKLDVEMTWAKGIEDPETASWTDASQGAIFKNDKWEPGYAEARHIKITNAGTLALKYKINFKENGEVSALADVIDVYYVDPAVAVEERADLDDSFKIGTLTEVLANMGNTATGKLLKGESDTITLVLKMREDAGNEYQEMSIGSSFSIQLLATQATAENDSWGDDYDADAEYPIVYIENADHDSTVDTLIQSGKVDVTVPAGASAGAYTLEASEPSKTVDADGNETVTIEITLKKDGAKVAADGTTLYTVSVEIGTGLNLTKVTHNGEAVEDYTYDSVTGIITFETAHFSPFSFTYDLGEQVESVEDIYALVEDGGVVQLNGDTTLTTDKPLEIKKDTVLNLNGYKLSGTSTTATTNYLIKVDNGASLIIQNGTVSFLATKPDTDWDPEGFPGYANNTIVAQGEVIINGVTVVNETAAGGASYAIDCYPGCDVTINDGSVIDGRGKVAIRMFANSNTSSTKVTVNGGTLTGTRAIWVQLPGSNASSKKMVDLTVNGGNLISTDKEGYNLAIYSYSYGDSFENTNITFNGGSFDGNVAFSGGTNKATRENVTIDWTKCSFTGDVYYYTEDAICEYVFDAEGLKAALDAGNDVILANDITADDDMKITVASGVDAVLDLNGKTLVSVSTKTGANYDFIDVRGTLTVKNGTVTTKHTGTNMGWNNSTNVFNVTAGGVLNIENATVTNFGGSDMAFGVHLNNWGEVTLNAKNTVFQSTYVGIRVFNSGYDMNNVTLDGCTVDTVNSCFWVHNWTAADFGNDAAKAEAADARLNFIFLNTKFVREGSLSLVRFGFTNAIYYTDVDMDTVCAGNVTALRWALENGKSVELTQDINLSKIDLTDAITNDVVINANGHKITTTDAYGIEVTAGKNITISNANVEMTKAGDYITYAAGFKIANGDYAGATITLENCTITMANTDWAYAVNMPASVKNLNLVIDNCTLEGAIAVQCWGDNNTITITDSKLICNYTTNAQYTSYCVALQRDNYNAAENNTLVIDNCEFLYSGIDNFNSVIKAAADVSGSNTVTVTNCTYGEKVVAE